MKKINSFQYKEGSYYINIQLEAPFRWEFIIYRKGRLLTSGWALFRFYAVILAHKKLKILIEDGIYK